MRPSNTALRFTLAEAKRGDAVLRIVTIPEASALYDRWIQRARRLVLPKVLQYDPITAGRSPCDAALQHVPVDDQPELAAY